MLEHAGGDDFRTDITRITESTRVLSVKSATPIAGSFRDADFLATHTPMLSPCTTLQRFARGCSFSYARCKSMNIDR